MANEFTQVKDQNNVVHPVCDSTARSSISGILDGTTIDSFADVESALSGKEDTLTFDDTPTSASTNPVKSGGVYSAINDVYVANGVTGAKNLFIPTSKGGTINDLTLTIDDDNIFTLSGTPSDTVVHELGYIPTSWAGKEVILTGCPSGGDADTYRLDVRNSSGQTTNDYLETGDGLKFTVGDYYRIYFRTTTTSGDLTGKEIKVMVRLATDTDPTYAPYAMTNRELTDAVNLLPVEVFSATTMKDIYNAAKAKKADGFKVFAFVNTTGLPSIQTGFGIMIWHHSFSASYCQVIGAYQGNVESAYISGS